MESSPESIAFDRAVSPLLRSVLPGDSVRDVISFHLEPGLRLRVEELASKSTEGELTSEERLEYQGYVRANQFIAVLQQQARRLLNPAS